MPLLLSYCGTAARTVALRLSYCGTAAVSYCFSVSIAVTYCRSYEPKWQQLSCATIVDKSFWLKDANWLVSKAMKAGGGAYSAGTVVEYLRKQGGLVTLLCVCLCVCNCACLQSKNARRCMKTIQCAGNSLPPWMSTRRSTRG